MTDDTGDEDNERNPVFIVFIDALDINDIPEDTWLYENVQAQLEAPVLNVTPCIMGPAFTGKDASHHNLVRAHTRLYDDNVVRPACTHLFEELSENHRVLSHRVPFTMNLQLEYGDLFPSAPQVQVNTDQPWMKATRGDFSALELLKGNEDEDIVLNAEVDYTWQYFANFRQVARNNMFDVLFLSYRDVDMWTHFYREDFKEILIRQVSNELKAIEQNNFEVIFWSDHGSREMTDVFRINRWLIENGWLDVDIHMHERNKTIDPEEEEVTEQIDLASQYVQIEPGSIAWCSDAFDTCIDVADDASEAEIKSLVEQLQELDAFTEVYRKDELFDEHGPKFDEVPEIIPQRAPGVMVSGNIYPEAPIWNGDIDAQGSIRTGVHRRDTAVIGGSVDLGLDKEYYKPEDLYDIFMEFTAEYAPVFEQEVEDLHKEQDDDVKGRLEELGYV